ncbi:MAG: MFS transporter [Actinomycetota bacterium]
MSVRSDDPARQFVRGFGLAEGLEWGFWLAASVWWIVVLDLGPVQLVAMGAVLEASVLLAETPTGVVADLVSRRRSFAIGQALMGVAFIWAVISTNYWVILPAQAIFGVGWTFRSGADTAWVTDELKGMGRADDTDVERLLIRKHQFGIAFGLVALFVVMVVGTLTSVRVAIVAVGCASLVLAGWMATAMHEHHFTPGRERDRGFFETLRKGFSVVRTRPRLRLLVVVLFTLDLGSEAFDRLGHKRFLDEGGWADDSLIGLWVLFTVLSVAGLIVNGFAGRALDRGFGVARLAVVLLAVASAGAFLSAATSIVLVIGLGLMFQDATRESLWPVMEGWANRDAPSEVRATVHSLMGQTTALGELTGGLALGALAQVTSIRLVLCISAGLWAVSALLATRGIEHGDVRSAHRH